MVKVKIDGKECEFRAVEGIKLSLKHEKMVDLEVGCEGQSIKFLMPLNRCNCEIFGSVGDVHPIAKFNSEWHSMTIERDGILLFSGTAYLMQVVWDEGARFMEVECRGGVVRWVENAASTLFKNINISLSTMLNTPNFKQGWLSDSDVKFFPITRDRYEPEGSATDVTGVHRLRSFDDYHPFIKLSALIGAIVEVSGYTVDSQTGVDEHFDEIYISGNYKSSDVGSAAEEKMGFYVKRTEDVSTTADFLGCVSMSPYDLSATVGNIVDIESVASDYECYNHGGCLEIDNKALIYRPLTNICMGFEYYLHYTCDCTLESRTTMSGINRFDTVNNGYVEWEITNRNVDQRSDIRYGIDYKLAIFGVRQGDVFQAVATTTDGHEVVVTTFIFSKWTNLQFAQNYKSLRVDKSVDGAWVEYDDWALYFGFVEDVTPTEVKITIRTAAKDYSPTSPMRFESQLLRGASAGANFKLFKDSSVRPYFSAYPSYNSTVTFQDIANHSLSALDFLGSIQHLFNLRFLTNEAAKSVVIESFDNFYGGDVWDWSDKVVESTAVEFVDYAHFARRHTKYGYQQLDGVVKRLGQSDNRYFGEWTLDVDSYAAGATSRTLLNPMLSASTNDDDGVLVVGDRDDLAGVNSLGFSPRIARYLGMQGVENDRLPFVAFHAPLQDFTLCFEDRDGVCGLNRLYQHEAELFERGQLISLELRLTALDFLNLIEPVAGAASVRSEFRFRLKGESFRTILYGVESYNVETGVAMCTFLTID